MKCVAFEKYFLGVFLSFFYKNHLENFEFFGNNPRISQIYLIYVLYIATQKQWIIIELITHISINWLTHIHFLVSTLFVDEIVDVANEFKHQFNNQPQHYCLVLQYASGELSVLLSMIRRNVFEVFWFGLHIKVLFFPFFANF